MDNTKNTFKATFFLRNDKYLRYVLAEAESEIEWILNEEYSELHDLKYKEVSLEKNIEEYDRLITKNFSEIESRTNEIIKKKRANLEYIEWLDQIRNHPKCTLSLYKVSYLENDLEWNTKVLATNYVEAIALSSECLKIAINAVAERIDINLLINKNNAYVTRLEGHIQRNIYNFTTLMNRKYELINLKQIIDNNKNSSQKIFRLTPK